MRRGLRGGGAHTHTERGWPRPLTLPAHCGLCYLPLGRRARNKFYRLHPCGSVLVVTLRLLKPALLYPCSHHGAAPSAHLQCGISHSCWEPHRTFWRTMSPSSHFRTGIGVIPPLNASLIHLFILSALCTLYSFNTVIEILLHTRSLSWVSAYALL